jgi:hypothetical protein
MAFRRSTVRSRSAPPFFRSRPPGQHIERRSQHVPGAEEKFKQKFEAMFRGLTKAQADAKKNELLAEARRRFGDDAKTLSQTQNLINLQARKSLPGGLLPAVSR